MQSKNVYPICWFLQHHLANKLHKFKTSAKNLLPLGDRNQLVIQLRLRHNWRQTNLLEFLSDFSQKHIESRQVQTDEMNTETMRRFESFNNGSHSAAFSKIMDKLTSGYGKFDVDNNVFFVKFIVDEKYEF